MKLTFMPVLRKQQMKKQLCGLLAGAGLMLGSAANAAAMHFDQLHADGGHGNGAHGATQPVTNDGAQANAIRRGKGWFTMDDLSLDNVSKLPEPGAAALLVLAVLALGVVRARNIQ